MVPMYMLLMKMEWSEHSLDIFLAPVSIVFTIGYHLFLWHSFKNKHPSVSIRAPQSIRRRAWFLHIIDQDNEKRGILTVQSLRNSMMTVIIISLLAVILNSSLAAQTNNVYKARGLVHDSPITSSTESTQILKYATASLFLLLSFVCSSMAIASLIEASFLIYVTEDLLPQYAHHLLERAFTLAIAGERVLYITVPLMLWMFGPVAMTLSSLAMVWVLYQLDFTRIVDVSNKEYK